MSEKRKPIKKVKPKKIGKSRYSLLIIIVMLIVLAIPVYILGDILYNAYIRQGVPIVGDRYAGDLNPAITETDLNSISTAIRAYEEVERVDVYLQTSTLKVYVDVKSDILHENYESLVTRAFETVTSTLPVETYFTQTSDKKMYDLEISVFNQTERVEGQEFIYFLLTKNSTMEEPQIREISSAKNQEVADRLRYEQALRDLGDSVEQPPVEEPPVEESETP